MQRLASQSLHSRLTFQASFLGMLRSLACCQTQALHTTTAQCKKQTTEEDELPAADGAISDVGASSSSDSDADSLSDSEASTADAQSAEAAAAAAVEAAGASAENQAYRGLDHKDFNITLKYNNQFMMDPDRGYSIGYANAYEKRIRLELRKALAAQRLQLKDAAHAAGGRRQPSMSQQMNSRLADMQSYMNNPMGQ